MRTSTVRYSDVPAYSKVYPRPFRYNRYSSVAPHVAMGHGPYLLPCYFKQGALRMASEDS
jgi:hypothetical protein